jgi:hypothetical protein
LRSEENKGHVTSEDVFWGHIIFRKVIFALLGRGLIPTPLEGDIHLLANIKKHIFKSISRRVVPLAVNILSVKLQCEFVVMQDNKRAILQIPAGNEFSLGSSNSVSVEAVVVHGILGTCVP